MLRYSRLHLTGVKAVNPKYEMLDLVRSAPHCDSRQCVVRWRVFVESLINEGHPE
jgi:hypothetical protein